MPSYENLWYCKILTWRPWPYCAEESAWTNNINVKQTKDFFIPIRKIHQNLWIYNYASTSTNKNYQLILKMIQNKSFIPFEHFDKDYDDEHEFFVLKLIW